MCNKPSYRKSFSSVGSRPAAGRVGDPFGHRRRLALSMGSMGSSARSCNERFGHGRHLHTRCQRLQQPVVARPSPGRRPLAQLGCLQHARPFPGQVRGGAGLGQGPCRQSSWGRAGRHHR
eukprot:3524259-Alexandrium_andersonii.AAC.1